MVEKIRCMLRMANLPKSFWGEAIVTACYLINRSPSFPLNFDIPKRVWTEKDVFYSHLKVFGCKAFVHVPRNKDQSLIANPLLVYLLDMEMQNLATSYGIQKKRR